MDPLTILGLGTTIYGGLKSIFGKDNDPYAEQRKIQRKLMAKSKAVPGVIKNQAFNSMARQQRIIEDQSAAAGTPQNVVSQRMGDTFAMGNQQLLGSLAREEQNAIMRESQIASMIPPEEIDNSASDLLGLGLELLTSGGGPKKKQVGLSPDQLKQLQGANPWDFHSGNIVGGRPSGVGFKFSKPKPIGSMFNTDKRKPGYFGY